MSVFSSWRHVVVPWSLSVVVVVLVERREEITPYCQFVVLLRVKRFVLVQGRRVLSIDDTSLVVWWLHLFEVIVHSWGWCSVSCRLWLCSTHFAAVLPLYHCFHFIICSCCVFHWLDSFKLAYDLSSFLHQSFYWKYHRRLVWTLYRS